MIFGDGVGTSLVRALIANSVLVSVTLMRFYIGIAQLKKFQGGTGFNLLRVQFWNPRAKETFIKKDQKVDPLEIKTNYINLVAFWMVARSQQAMKQ